MIKRYQNICESIPISNYKDSLKLNLVNGVGANSNRNI